MKNIFQWVFVGVLSLLSTVSPSFAQNFPNKPIQIIVPVAAGGDRRGAAAAARAAARPRRLGDAAARHGRSRVEVLGGGA